MTADPFLPAHQLVCDWYQVEPQEVEVSWGYRGDEFETNDPLRKVRITRGKIILKEYDPLSDIWLIDLVRGFLYYYLPIDIKSTSSAWKLLTVIALVLIPTTMYDEGKKTMYRRGWKESREYINTKPRYMNYLTIYQQLASFGRVSVLQSLYQFIHTYFQPDEDLETQLNMYLHHQLQSMYTPLDKKVLAAALEYQTLDTAELAVHLGMDDKQLLYPVLQRLNFHIGQHLLASRDFTGLDRMILPHLSEEQYDQIKQLPFYVSQIFCRDKDQFFVYFYFPRQKTLEFLMAVQSASKQLEVYLQLPQTAEVRASPEMFNTETKTWKSVKEDRYPIYNCLNNFMKIQEAMKTGSQNTESIVPTKEELQLLLPIVYRNEDDYRKISIDFSRSRTKQLVRKLQKKNAYASAVLWRRPIDLPKATYLVPLSEEHEITELPDSLQDLYRTMRNWKKEKYQQLFENISTYSWPYISVQYCMQIQRNQTSLKLQNVVILEIEATETDHTFLQQMDHVSLLGMNKFSQGSFLKLPIDHYDKGWILDIEKYVSLINSNKE